MNGKMGVAFLTKAISPKWKLAESISRGGGANTNDESGKTQLCQLLQLSPRIFYPIQSILSGYLIYEGPWHVRPDVDGISTTSRQTRTTAILDFPEVYIDGASIEGIKTQKYTEID